MSFQKSHFSDTTIYCLYGDTPEKWTPVFRQISKKNRSSYPLYRPASANRPLLALLHYDTFIYYNIILI